MRPLIRMVVAVVAVAVVVLLESGPSLAKPRKHTPLDLATWHSNQGVRFLAAEEYAKAEVEFKTAVEVDPKYPEAHSNLGLIFKYKGELEAATKEFRTAIELDPKWAAPYNHLGTVYLKEGKFLKAIDYFKRAANLDKKFADAHYNLGVTYLEQAKRTKHPKGDWQKAARAFQKATSIDPRLYNAHMELANTYRMLGKIEKSILRYRLAIETNPNDSKPWELLANLYEDQGEDAKAEECRRQAHRLTPEGKVEQTAEGLLNLGESYRRQRLYPQALKAYEAATNQQRDFWQAHFGIGETLEAMGDRRRATAAYEAVLQIHPNHPESLFHLGRIQIQTGQSDEGMKNLCHFIEVTRDTPGLDQEKAAASEATVKSGGCR